jgi:recombination protein RecT
MRTQDIAPAGNTAVAARGQKDIQALLNSEQFKRAVGAALPKHLTPDRFVRLSLTALMRTPKLRECTQESLFKCLLDLSMLGLEPDGRRAHLIPYGNECTLIIDYKGIVELVRRSGDVSYIHADVVYEKDEFDYTFGTGSMLKHKPNMEDRGARVIGAYSFVKLRDGSEDFIVMSKGDIDKVRKRSRAATNGPWVTDWDEMAKKTVFRRHSKWLPLSVYTRDAIEKDDDAMDIPRQVETSSVAIDAFVPSSDPNRGHDETMPPEAENSSTPAPATQSKPAPAALNASGQIGGYREWVAPEDPKQERFI